MALECLYCGSDKLYYYQERLLIEKRRITNDGRISEKVLYREIQDDFGGMNHEYIDCESCSHSHVFEETSEGIVLYKLSD